MSEPTAIESEIRNLIRTESCGITLSNKLFQQGGGLFARLAANEADRRAQGATELFRKAQERVFELMNQDAEILAKLDDECERAHPGVAVTIKTTSLRSIEKTAA